MACSGRNKVASAAGLRSRMSGLAMKDTKSAATSRPCASLGPLLLARKGTAKPAMRAQFETAEHAPLSDVDALAASQEALGWNDMGEDLIIAEELPVVAASEAKAEPSEPVVRRQLDELVHRIADSNLIAFQAAEQAAQPMVQTAAETAAEQGRRAAFTLRLDEERHLRLRLASTVQGESAQALVTRALDSLLSQMPEIENLAAQVRPKGQSGKSKG